MSNSYTHAFIEKDRQSEWQRHKYRKTKQPHIYIYKNSHSSTHKTLIEVFALFFHLFVDFVLSRRSLHFTQNDDWQTAALEVCCWCLAGEVLDENNLISFYTINYEHYSAHSLFLGLSYKQYVYHPHFTSIT